MPCNMDQYGVFSHLALNSNATISSVTSGVYKQLPPRAFKGTQELTFCLDENKIILLSIFSK